MCLMNDAQGGLCYHEKCHCPEGNEPDLEDPGSELLTKLHQLRRDKNQKNYDTMSSDVTDSQGLVIFQNI